MELYILKRTLLCKWASMMLTCKISSSRLKLSPCIHFICLSGRNIFCGGKIFSSGAEYWPKRQIYPWCYYQHCMKKLQC